MEDLDIGKSTDKSTLSSLKNYCLEENKHFNFGELSADKKLKLFKSGKCSPVVIVPGILATSLIIQLNCT